MNTRDTTKSFYYVVNYVSEAYTLQENTPYYGKTNTTGKLVVKAQYLSCMRAKTKWYWKKTQYQ